MKNSIIFLLLCINLYSESLNIKIVESIPFDYGKAYGTEKRRILCIDGYKWLQYGYVSSLPAQMFQNTNGVLNAVPCK